MPTCGAINCRKDAYARVFIDGTGIRTLCKGCAQGHEIREVLDADAVSDSEVTEDV